MTTQAKAPPVAPAPAATTPVPSPKPAPTRETRKFTVAEYYRMGEAGILKPDERVELIEGEIIVMPPIGPGHAMSVNISNQIFSLLADNRYIVSIQNPIHLDERSEPQPDVALLRPPFARYATSHPTPSDVLLVVEVADSSLEYDRQTKAHVYGRAGIQETWVRNLPEDCIERFTGPGAEGYARHSVHRRGETLAPASLPGLELAVADLLPPPPAESSEQV